VYDILAKLTHTRFFQVTTATLAAGRGQLPATGGTGMNKLRLELDDLRVDTFATSGSAGSERGTVRAHGGVGGGDSIYEVCEPLPPDYTEGCPPHTHAVSCYGSCYNSCNGSCYNTCYTYYQNTCAYASCQPCSPVPDEP
jgi:hypothetical protein